MVVVSRPTRARELKRLDGRDQRVELFESVLTGRRGLVGLVNDGVQFLGDRPVEKRGFREPGLSPPPGRGIDVFVEPWNYIKCLGSSCGSPSK